MEFQLLRLRLLRPPPSQFDCDRTVTCQLGLTVQDDYGLDFIAVPSVALELAVLDERTRQVIPGIHYSYAPHRLELASTPCHALKLTLNFSSRFIASSPLPRIVIHIVARGIGEHDGGTEGLSEDSRALLSMVGEESRGVTLVEEDQRKVIFMGVTSGPVELIRGGGPRESARGGNGKAKAKEPASFSSEKVQTALRRVHLAQHTITLIERPGLQNSTGQRLWDCSIALAYYLSINPRLLSSSRDGKGEERDPKRTKLDRDDEERTTVIELGAGLGLVSLAASLFFPSPTTRVIATDIAATVSTTLSENLDAFPHCTVRREVLDWGIVATERVSELLDGDFPLLLGSDILYNPSSHQVLLETILSFLGPSSRGSRGRGQALIAYKPRTEGDDLFFPLAVAAGLKVHKLWFWSNIGIWHFAWNNHTMSS